MKKWILSKDRMRELVSRALANYRVFAPVKRGSVVLFQQISNSSEFTLDFSNTKLPPKCIFFPQTETLFRFTLEREVKIEPLTNAQNKILLIGIRPCDGRSLVILDNVFKGEYEDPYYLWKRENAILIGLSCIQPMVNCFCLSLKGGPTATEGMDILLTDIGEKYFVEVVSEKGQKFIDSMISLFTPATKIDEKKKAEIDKKAETSIKRYLNIEGLIDKLDKIFESIFWRKIAMKCLGCGICTFLCPTCHCFDIQDETTIRRGARIRVWDSCMYPEFTAQASGYNPRPERMNRVRNRIYHKYSYFPKNFGVTACVGCGRCIEGCPVNIDVIDIISKIRVEE